MVGEVSGSRFDGGARPAERLHEWLRGRYADDETAFNIDLTACQFYIHLGSCYTGDPCTPPLGANIVGAAFGEEEVLVHEYGNPAHVVSVLKSAPFVNAPFCVDALKSTYCALGME